MSVHVCFKGDSFLRSGGTESYASEVRLQQSTPIGAAHVRFSKAVKWKVVLVVGGIQSVSRLLVLCGTRLDLVSHFMPSRLALPVRAGQTLLD